MLKNAKPVPRLEHFGEDIRQFPFDDWRKALIFFLQQVEELLSTII